MKIPLIEIAITTAETHERQMYADCRPLPASYMSEYSVLGLQVDDLDRAIDALSENGFSVHKEAFGAEIGISGAVQLPGIIQILAGAGVYGSIGDVIDSVYQG